MIIITDENRKTYLQKIYGLIQSGELTLDEFDEFDDWLDGREAKAVMDASVLVQHERILNKKSA